MHYKVPVVEGRLDIDYADMMEGLNTEPGTACVKLRETAEVRDGWEPITEEEFEAHRPPKPEPQPDEPTEIDIIGQQLVEKDLQILDLQEQNEMIGAQVVAIDLKNMEMEQDNQIQGNQLVDMDLRLMNIEMGGM